MLFDRIKPLNAILAVAEKKSLERTRGPLQLTLLGLGAVIGTGSFEDDGESLRHSAEDAIDVVKDAGTYTDAEIENVTDKVNEWKDRLNDRQGRAKVKEWPEDLD